MTELERCKLLKAIANLRELHRDANYVINIKNEEQYEAGIAAMNLHFNTAFDTLGEIMDLNQKKYEADLQKIILGLM